MKYRLTLEQLSKIYEVLDKGDRIELIPVKGGKIKIIKEARKEIKD